jgi:hypothetical protein
MLDESFVLWKKYSGCNEYMDAVDGSFQLWLNEFAPESM